MRLTSENQTHKNNKIYQKNNMVYIGYSSPINTIFWHCYQSNYNWLCVFISPIKL